MLKASVVKIWFMPKTTGNMLEAQVGSIDITQSVAKKVIRIAQMTMPGALRPTSLRLLASSSLASKLFAQRRIVKPINPNTPK